MSTTVSHQVPTAQQQAISDLTGYEDAATLRWQQACVQAANTLTALPNGRYLEIPHAGHLGFIERPQVVNAAALKFFADSL